MSLIIPNLDDKTFDELVEEARTRIPRYAPEWTDHNLSDPGITFLELFAWLAEMQIYSLNRVTDRHYSKFLKLLGIRPRPAVCSRANVTFYLSEEETKSVDIKKGTKVAARDPESGADIIFETDQDLSLVPVELREVLTYSSAGVVINTEANKYANSCYHAFGKSAEQGSMLYLGFDKPFPPARVDIKLAAGWNKFSCPGDPATRYMADLVAGLPVMEWVWAWDAVSQVWRKADTVEFGIDYWIKAFEDCILTIEYWPRNSLESPFRAGMAVELYEEDLPPRGSCGDEKPAIFPSAELIWEYWNGSHWKALEIVRDTTTAFSASGVVLFTISSDLAKRKQDPIEEELYWLRCRVLKAGYEVPPVIDSIILNTVPAIQQATVEEEFLGGSDGLPDQIFRLRYTPIVPESQIIAVKEAGYWKEWEEVDDFDGSGPEDMHYTLNRATGEVTFGNGINGRIPPGGEYNIKASYRFGGGEKGNVAAKQINTILEIISDHVIPKGVKVINNRAASGGKEEESLDEAKERSIRDSKARYRAINSEDFETLAKSTPGVRVARVKALPLYHPDCPGIRADGVVTLVVIPYSPPDIDKPMPSQGFVKTVHEHIEKHRLLATEVHITGPEYVKISVSAEVKARQRTNPDEVRAQVEESLRTFLHPITGGPNKDGWPFGRHVFRSEVYQVIEAVPDVDYAYNVVLRAEGDYEMQRGDVKMPRHGLTCSGEHRISVL